MKRKTQAPWSALIGDELSADQGAGGGIKSRLDRYTVAHARALSIADYLSVVDARDNRGQPLADQLRHCGSWMILRHFYLADQSLLQSTSSCDRALLCPFCAIRRGARLVRRYDARIRTLCEDHPRLGQYLVTFTIKNREDLRDVWQRLRRALQKYHEQRKHALKGLRSWVEACKCYGSVWSYEVKLGAGSGLWHPHCHALWLCDDKPDRHQLIKEWSALLDDGTWDVHVRKCDGVDGLLEVFKYALKFSSMTPADIWHAYQQLQGCRLIGSFGKLRGMKDDELTAAENVADGPYIDLLYRWAVAYYECAGPAGRYQYSVDPFKGFAHYDVYRRHPDYFGRD